MEPTITEQLLTQATIDNPLDTTLQLVLADAVQERTGDYSEKGRKAAEKQAKQEAKLAAVAQARVIVDANTKQAQKVRATVRKLAKATTSYPVVVIIGKIRPRLIGRPAYYTTPAGRPVYHPNAYKRAWGKVVRHASTVRVEVGAEWVLAHLT